MTILGSKVVRVITQMWWGSWVDDVLGTNEDGGSGRSRRNHDGDGGSGVSELRVSDAGAVSSKEYEFSALFSPLLRGCKEWCRFSSDCCSCFLSFAVHVSFLAASSAFNLSALLSLGTLASSAFRLLNRFSCFAVKGCSVRILSSNASLRSRVLSFSFWYGNTTRKSLEMCNK